VRKRRKKSDFVGPALFFFTKIYKKDPA